MKNVVERFQVRAEDGTILNVVIYQKQLDVTTDDDKGARTFLPGLKEVRLADGRSLNRIDANTFKLVQTGQVLTRITGTTPVGK